MFPIPSAGELLRRERARPGSKYGELIERTIVAGNIVPAEITCALLHSAMDSSGRQFISLKIIWVILGVIFLAILGILINPGSVAFIALCITESDLGQNCVGVAHKRHSWKMTYFNLPPKILSWEMTNKYVPGSTCSERFCKMFSDSSPGCWAVLQLHCCHSKQGELSENLLQNRRNSPPTWYSFPYQFYSGTIFKQFLGNVFNPIELPPCRQRELPRRRVPAQRRQPVDLGPRDGGQGARPLRPLLRLRRGDLHRALLAQGHRQVRQGARSFDQSS